VITQVPEELKQFEQNFKAYNKAVLTKSECYQHKNRHINQSNRIEGSEQIDTSSTNFL
jgi:hypothetical protein